MPAEQQKYFCRREGTACNSDEFEVHPTFGLIHKTDPPHTLLGSTIDLDVQVPNPGGQ